MEFIKKQMGFLFVLLLLCGCDNNVQDLEKFSNAEQIIISTDQTLESKKIEGVDISQPTIEELPNKAIVTTINTENACTNKNGVESSTHESVIDNWYIDGYIIPENWLPVMSSDEANSQIDNLINLKAENDNIEEAMLILTNRNVIVFNVMQLTNFEFYDSLEGINYQDEKETILKVYSDYFCSVEDIHKLFYDTYIDDVANILFFNDVEMQKARFSEDNEGNMYINIQGMGTGTQNPFDFQTYIEILDFSENYCKFVWHYIEYDFWDYEGNRTKEMLPHHKKVLCEAIKEKDKWQLTDTFF